MTYVSPILRNRINNSTSNQGIKNPNQRHEKIYEDLRKRANEVKPNEAKAYMVKEGMFGNPITAAKDTMKDGTNFFKAVLTGNIGDNNLGRINDLGLKVGAGLIATFLASRAKTKTKALMQFIGGGTFLASMSLWPKLFINLPARLVHGFRIDRKYISAQGDKKDFGLDNQFLVWDAYPEEQLRKDAKNAGIDYDSKNGKEKIQRKIQKTMLQNRTLWMATAGFATPLMTAMIGNAVEPKVESLIIKKEFNRVKDIVGGNLSEYIQNVPSEVHNVAEIDNLSEAFQQGKLTKDEFFQKLAELLNPTDFLEKYKDSDDAKPLASYTGGDNVVEQLEQLYKSKRSIQTEDLEKLLAGAKRAKLGDKRAITPEEIKDIIKSLNGDMSYANVQKTLQEHHIAKTSIENILETATADDSKFIEYIKEFNKGPLAQARARLKAYMDLLNPVVGSKSESVFTSEYNKYMKKIMKSFGFDSKTLSSIRQNDGDIIKLLSEKLQEQLKGVEYDSDEYRKIIQNFSTQDLSDDVSDVLKALSDNKNIESIISGLQDNEASTLLKSILGNEDSSKGILKVLSQYIDIKQTDLNSIKSRALLCANFESRLAKGAKGDLAGLVEEEIEVARKLLYDGPISTFYNNGHSTNKKAYDNVIEKVFKGPFKPDEGPFRAEIGVMPSLKSFIKQVKDIAQGTFKGSSNESYSSCSSFVALIKNEATKLTNNKAWMKIFAPMAIALVAVTLLVQPFFGNIKKEFPEEKQGGIN